jgi:uncharacterized protein
MNNFKHLIETTQAFVKSKLEIAEPGHDWWHAYRVWKSAIYIAEKETAVSNNDMLIIQLAALLHDIADAKFNNGDEKIGVQITAEFLQNQGLSKDLIDQVLFIVEHISFKGGEIAKIVHTKPFDIVQDADRLDALGAIGIARTFSYGGYKLRPLYDPEILPLTSMTKDEYRKSTAPTINHFYEKLFKLKDLMNTETAREMANERHQFMETFLAQFYREWGLD